MKPTHIILIVAILLPGLARGAEDIELLEQQAFQAAVDRVAPSVVAIETVGGLERVGKLLIGTGPTTGLIVDKDGYIVSSAFNFINKPASILVRLSDGQRKPAELVATDRNRMLVLLKIAVDKPLPVPEIVPHKEMRVGQWTLAVGRTFEGDRPNVSVGILSAVNRVWGKAIQTDAAVSPSNYGGPLIDITGRVLGVLAPLSPKSASEMAGVEWYDSGIGMAIPAEHLLKILPRLKKGEELHTGLMGIAFASRNLATADAVIGACPPNSPAYEVGFRKKDKIVEIDGAKIARAAQVKEETSRRYAGQSILVVVMRGDKRIEHELTLVAKLKPYQRTTLGIVPMRPLRSPPKPRPKPKKVDDKSAKPEKKAEEKPAKPAPKIEKKVEEKPIMPGEAKPKETTAAEPEKPKKAKPVAKPLTNPIAKKAEPEPVTVRFVCSGGPAEKAGVKPGDQVVSLDGEPVKSIAALRAKVGQYLPGEELPLEIRRGSEMLKLTVKLETLPEDMSSGDLPTAHAPGKPIKTELPAVGSVPLKLEKHKNEVHAYIPANYNPTIPYGVVVWLHGEGGVDHAKLIASWKPHCDRHELILLVPKSADPKKWADDEPAVIGAAMRKLASTYAVDATRVAVCGRGDGGKLAYQLAFNPRSSIAAVASIATTQQPGKAPDTNPRRRLAIYIATAGKESELSRIDRAVAELREMKYPVIVKKLGETPRDLTPAETAELARWFDTLDRI